MNRIARLALPLAVWFLGCTEKPPAPSSASSGPSASASAPGARPAPGASASASAPGGRPGPAPDAIAAQHVLVAYKGAKGAPRSVSRSKADARRRAEEIALRAKAGEFAALVAEYSDDPASKERMGSVGKFTRDKMTKPFSDAAFALAVDEVSGVVESDFGFHVIKRNQ